MLRYQTGTRPEKAPQPTVHLMKRWCNAYAVLPAEGGRWAVGLSCPLLSQVPRLDLRYFPGSDNSRKMLLLGIT